MHTTPRKQPTQARSKATVDAILEATARVLVADGYAKTSTNRVAKVAGVSVGSLYQYFPSKEALIYAVAERHAQTMVGLLAETMTDLADAPIEQAVRTYIDAMIQAHLIDPELHHRLMQLVFQVGLSQMTEIDDAATELIEGYLASRPETLATPDLKTASWVLMTTVEALIHMAVLQRPELLSDGRLTDEICAVVLRYLGVDCRSARRGK